jgi:hypothetical protein
VLSQEARDDIRRRQALYHDVVAGLVATLRPGDPRARVRSEAILALCDRVKSWGDAGGLTEADMADEAWTLAAAMIGARTGRHEP